MQEITIVETEINILDRPEMEEKQMEKGKHQGTRPEMGTPEYEEWRKRMLARRRKRLQREPEETADRHGRGTCISNRRCFRRDQQL